MTAGSARNVVGSMARLRWQAARRGWLVGCGAILLLLSRPVWCVELVLDYRYDSVGQGGSDFFGAGNPLGEGREARTTLAAAADFLSELITDSLNAIPWTDPMTPSAEQTPVWRQVITHPGTGQPDYAISSAANALEDGLTASWGPADEFRDLSIARDEYLIYAGGSGISSVGLGGTGVRWFGPPEFNAVIDQRGKPPGQYSTWGGYVTFRREHDWHFDHTQPVPEGKTDFFSIAVHELGHALGLNVPSSEWEHQHDGDLFLGHAALRAWHLEDPAADMRGIPTVGGDDRHWQNNALQSFAVGTQSLQEVAMDPILLPGTRKRMTNVDAMALVDLGWSVQLPVAGDFDGDDKLTTDDIDLLNTAIANQDGSFLFDLNNDMYVDEEDRRVWVEDFKRTVFGDVDLNGILSASEDGAVLLSSLGTSANAGWAAGDYNGDGLITASGDGSLLLASFAQDAAFPARALPEPSPLWMSLLAALVVAGSRPRGVRQ